MEKYSRQALAEGVKNVSDLVVTNDCELYRVLILHYNRNNQIEVRIVTTSRAARRNCSPHSGTPFRLLVLRVI